MKKTLVLMFSILLMFTASNTAFAGELSNYQLAMQLIDDTNQEIDAKINKGVEEADKLQQEYLEAIKTANEKEVKELTAKYEKELTKIIEGVFYETLKMSSKTIGEAYDLGVLAECSWKLVQFADREVLIDPIQVIGRN
jgi:vacuolar-type H+-ATPase subunit H